MQCDGKTSVKDRRRKGRRREELMMQMAGTRRTAGFEPTQLQSPPCPCPNRINRAASPNQICALKHPLSTRRARVSTRPLNQPAPASQFPNTFKALQVSGLFLSFFLFALVFSSLFPPFSLDVFILLSLSFFLLPGLWFVLVGGFLPSGRGQVNKVDSSRSSRSLSLPSR